MTTPTDENKPAATSNRISDAINKVAPYRNLILAGAGVAATVAAGLKLYGMFSGSKAQSLPTLTPPVLPALPSFRK